jgi:hypothetical protein
VQLPERSRVHHGAEREQNRSGVLRRAQTQAEARDGRERREQVEARGRDVERVRHGQP